MRKVRKGQTTRANDARSSMGKAGSTVVTNERTDEIPDRFFMPMRNVPSRLPSAPALLYIYRKSTQHDCTAHVTSAKIYTNTIILMICLLEMRQRKMVLQLMRRRWRRRRSCRRGGRRPGWSCTPSRARASRPPPPRSRRAPRGPPRRRADTFARPVLL